jgi:DDE_Tnp_1-associated
MVMERTAGDTGALGEAIVFLDYFKDLPDPRQRGKVLYPLDEVLLVCLLAVLAGSEAITDIARFGEKKLELLRRFRPFRDGTPSHDHLGDILATLDAEQFQRCFVAWVAALTGMTSSSMSGLPTFTLKARKPSDSHPLTCAINSSTDMCRLMPLA